MFGFVVLIFVILLAMYGAWKAVAEIADLFEPDPLAWMVWKLAGLWRNPNDDPIRKLRVQIREDEEGEPITAFQSLKGK